MIDKTWPYDEVSSPKAGSVDRGDASSAGSHTPWRPGVAQHRLRNTSIFPTSYFTTPSPASENSEERSMPNLYADTRGDLKLWLAVIFAGVGFITGASLLGQAFGGSL